MAETARFGGFGSFLIWKKCVATPANWRIFADSDFGVTHVSHWNFLILPCLCHWSRQVFDDFWGVRRPLIY